MSKRDDAKYAERALCQMYYTRAWQFERLTEEERSGGDVERQLDHITAYNVHIDKQEARCRVHGVDPTTCYDPMDGPPTPPRRSAEGAMQ